jgi:hypothetical protein
VVSIAKASMTRLQWNALAIITLIGFMPFAVAVITNAGSDSDGLSEDSIGPNPPNGPVGRGFWWDNGNNYSSHYESTIPMPSGWYNCVYIEEGRCGEDYSYSNDYLVPLTASPNNWINGQTLFQFGQTHSHSLSPGEYLGTSGSGPFGWYMYGESFNGIKSNESLDKISYQFIEYQTEYACEYNGFVDLDIYASLTFIRGNETYELENFVFETTNKFEWNRYDPSNGHWSTACVIGIELEFDFTGFESLGITEWNGGNWSETDHLIQIQQVVRADGQNIGSTGLPWAGDSFFVFGAEHESINTVQAGFIIKSLTTILSFGTFALAIASTPYWDPFKSFFKGAI